MQLSALANDADKNRADLLMVSRHKRSLATFWRRHRRSKQAALCRNVRHVKGVIIECRSLSVWFSSLSLWTQEANGLWKIHLKASAVHEKQKPSGRNIYQRGGTGDLSRFISGVCRPGWERNSLKGHKCHEKETKNKKQNTFWSLIGPSVCSPEEDSFRVWQNCKEWLIWRIETWERAHETAAEHAGAAALWCVMHGCTSGALHAGAHTARKCPLTAQAQATSLCMLFVGTSASVRIITCSRLHYFLWALWGLGRSETQRCRIEGFFRSATTTVPPFC